MLSLRAHFEFPTLFLAAGLCLVACSKKENTTALLVNVTTKPGVAIDTVVVVVDTGTTKFTGQFPWSDASGGTLETTLLLPAEAVGKDRTLQVQGTSGANLTAIPIGTLPKVTITAGKATGPIAVVLEPVVVPVGGDGGTDAVPSDGPQPDLSARPEVGIPDASATPDTGIDGPGAEAAALDVPVLSDVVQPVDVVTSPDAQQLSDVADAGADAPQPIDVGAEAAQPHDAVEAGADAGTDSVAASAWQPVENAQSDPTDPLGSLDSPGAIAVAVDPVRDHVYVMWADNSTWAVKVRRWNHTTGTWDKTQTLEHDGPGYPIDLQIGVDGAGHVIAAWHHYFISSASDTTVNQMGGVWVSRSADGNSWLPAESVTPQGTWQVVELCLAVARNGQARIAFTERLTVSPSTEQTYSAYFDGTTTWTTGSNPLAPEDPTDQNNHYPSIAIGDDGSGIILFTQPDSGGKDSVAASTFASATVDNFVILDSNTTDNLSEMAVAVNRSGQGVVVWGDTSGAMLRSYSPSTKTWTAARTIGNVDLYQPRAVVAPDGTATLAWSQWVRSSYNVWTMEGTAAGTWTTPMALEQDNLSIDNSPYASDTTETLPYPQLAVDGTGNVLVLWSKKTKNTPTNEFAVETRRKLAGTPNNWQPTTELARKSILLPWWLSLAVSDDGLGVASYYWLNPSTTPDPDEDQVFVSLFR